MSTPKLAFTIQYCYPPCLGEQQHFHFRGNISNPDQTIPYHSQRSTYVAHLHPPPITQLFFDWANYAFLPYPELFSLLSTSATPLHIE